MGQLRARSTIVTHRPNPDCCCFLNELLFLIIFAINFTVLGIKPRASSMLGQHSTIELHLVHTLRLWMEDICTHSIYFHCLGFFTLHWKSSCVVVYFGVVVQSSCDWVETAQSAKPKTFIWLLMEEFCQPQGQVKAGDTGVMGTSVRLQPRVREWGGWAWKEIACPRPGEALWDNVSSVQEYMNKSLAPTPSIIDMVQTVKLRPVFELAEVWSGGVHISGN